VSPDNQGAALSRLREALEEHGCSPQGRSALCPSHEDNQPSLTFGPKTRGQPGAMLHCHAQCLTSDVVADLDLTMEDLFDDPPPKPGKWGVGGMRSRVTGAAPSHARLTPAERDKIPVPERLVHGLVVERDWECSAFWEYVTRPFRGEPSTPEQRVKLAEMESSRLGQEQWDGWFLIHRRRPALRVIQGDRVTGNPRGNPAVTHAVTHGNPDGNPRGNPAGNPRGVVA
jgi:hypothetical protein